MSPYRPTESKYKGGAAEMYVTYDLDQKTRGGGHALYPKVKRVYIAGDVVDTKVGDRLKKRTGKQVHGVRIDYEQSRRPYRREDSARVAGATQRFSQVVEVPDAARNVHFYPSADALPAKYRDALQAVR